MTKKEMISLFDRCLVPQGYVRKDSVWYKDNPETVTILSLHRSRFGEEYFVTLSVLFTALSNERRVKFYKSHANFRVEDLGENTREYLDLDKDMDESMRTERVQIMLEKALKVLEKMASEEGFRQLLKAFNPRLFMLRKEAQKHLGVVVE